MIGTVEWSLRHQAHPNFIRWTICNGNRPRVIFARGLGVGGIVAGLAIAIILTLSSAGRGWRALSAVALVIGVATLFAAHKGMCVVSHPNIVGRAFAKQLEGPPWYASSPSAPMGAVCGC